MAWTEYQDALQQELDKLLSQRTWVPPTYSADGSVVYQQGYFADADPTRIAQIRSALSSAYDPTSANTRDQKLLDLVSQYETANQSAEAANEARYGQLVSGYNNRSASLLGNTDPWSYGAVAGQYQNLQDANASGQSAINSGFSSRANDVGSWLSAQNADSRQQQSGINTGFNSRASGIGDWLSTQSGNQRTAANDLSTAYGARQSQMQDWQTGQNATANANRSAIDSGFSSRASGIGDWLSTQSGNQQTAANDLSTAYGARQGSIGDWLSTETGSAKSAADNLDAAYASREGTIGSLFSGLGNQARADINSLYDSQRASQAQSLASRGLGNSTVGAAVNQGITRNQASDLNRLNDQLRTDEIGMRTQLSGDTLAARSANLAQRNQLLSQELGSRTQLSGDTLNARENAINMGNQLLSQELGSRTQLSGDALSAQQQNQSAREQLLAQELATRLQTSGDTLGARQNAINMGNQLLSQELGSRTQLSGDALTAQQAGLAQSNQLLSQELGSRTQLSGDALTAQQAGLQNANSIGLAANAYGATMADAAKEITQEPLGVIERRSDVAPSLSDIANLVNQLGRGSSSVTSLPGFSSLSGYGTDWTKLFQGLSS